MIPLCSLESIFYVHGVVRRDNLDLDIHPLVQEFPENRALLIGGGNILVERRTLLIHAHTADVDLLDFDAAINDALIGLWPFGEQDRRLFKPLLSSSVA